MEILKEKVIILFFEIIYLFLGIQLVLSYPSREELPEFIAPVEIPAEQYSDIPKFYPHMSESCQNWWQNEVEGLHMPLQECFEEGIIYVFFYFN